MTQEPTRLGEVIGDAFKTITVRCVKCKARTDTFEMFRESALCARCDEEAVEKRRAEVSAEALEIRKNSWKVMGLPYADTVLERIPCPQSKIDRVLGWKYGPKGIVVYGTTGLGKTRTVLKLVERLYLQDGYEFKFIRTPSWAHSIDSAPYGQSRHLVTALFFTPVLVLDDVGKEKPTERALAALFDVIDTRTSHGLPLIITSNYNGEKLQARLAECDAETSAAIMRRIREFCIPVSFHDSEKRPNDQKGLPSPSQTDLPPA